MQSSIYYNDIKRKFKLLFTIYAVVFISFILASYFYWSNMEEKGNFHVYNREADIIVNKFREILDKTSVQGSYLNELIKYKKQFSEKEIEETLKFFRNKILIKYSLFFIHDISWISLDGYIFKLNEKNQLTKEKLFIPEIDKNYGDFYLDKASKTQGKLFLSEYKNISTRDNNLLEAAFGISDEHGKLKGMFNFELSLPNIQASLEASQKHNNIKFLLLTRSLKVILDSTSTYNNYRNIENYSSKLDFLYRNADEDFIRPALYYKDIKYEYFQNNHTYDYLVLLGVRDEWFDFKIVNFLSAYYLQIGSLIAFFIFFNYYFTQKYKMPINDITDFASKILNGQEASLSSLKKHTSYILMVRLLIKVKNIIKKQDKCSKQIDNLIKANNNLVNRHKNITEYVFHDVKSPLTGALGKIEILVKEILGPIENKDYINYSNEVKTNIETAIEALDRLFEFNNLNNINFYITKQSTSLIEALEEIKNYYLNINLPKVKISYSKNMFNNIGIYCEERIVNFIFNNIINYYINNIDQLSAVEIISMNLEDFFAIEIKPIILEDQETINIASNKAKLNSQIELVRKLITVIFEGEFEMNTNKQEESMLIKLPLKLIEKNETTN